MEAFFSVETIIQQLEWMVRIFVAGVCGGAIGYERESRRKMAGLRTHAIVAVTSALMIVLSKYGFGDVLGEYVRLDPSRVAAGAVTAIGFLGSGVIFARNKSVSGITTSAGIWATLGVGMAIGAGMYIMGVATTLLVVLVETFLGRSGKLSYVIREIRLIEVEYAVSEHSDQLAARIRQELEEKHACRILKFQMKRHGDSIRLELLVKSPRQHMEFTSLIEEYPEITKISI